VLKLQKPAWTNDRISGGPGESGIFFSIWIDESAIARQRANYNIHALKLRELKGYGITSIAFAKDFRRAFSTSGDLWPNVSTDFGPQTLMQGWIPIRPSLERDLLSLLNRFNQTSRIIDSLLDCWMEG
jgi:hypothetical protein